MSDVGNTSNKQGVAPQRVRRKIRHANSRPIEEANGCLRELHRFLYMDAKVGGDESHESSGQSVIIQERSGRRLSHRFFLLLGLSIM